MEWGRETKHTHTKAGGFGFTRVSSDPWTKAGTLNHGTGFPGARFK